MKNQDDTVRLLSKVIIFGAIVALAWVLIGNSANNALKEDANDSSRVETEKKRASPSPSSSPSPTKTPEETKTPDYSEKSDSGSSADSTESRCLHYEEGQCWDEVEEEAYSAGYLDATDGSGHMRYTGCSGICEDIYADAYDEGYYDGENDY